jgi:hypothetical protein
MHYLLNSPVLTAYGKYSFEAIALTEAKEWAKNSFISAIGHAGTAELLSVLLEVDVSVNRVRIEMETEDEALVFRLLTRMEEGRVFSREEIAQLPFEFGLLTKLI